MSRPVLVALEGIDGCGKSTQLPHVAAALAAAGHDVVATREPTDGEWGSKIRVMAQTGDRPPADEELRWFQEDREAHVQEVIAPALADGKSVVTDRYYLSTVAYQGARDLDWRAILRESESRFPKPDLALLFEVAPSLGLQRVEQRAGTPEPAFERLETLTRVAEIFAALPCDYVVRVDGSGDESAVHRAWVPAVSALISRDD